MNKEKFPLIATLTEATDGRVVWERDETHSYCFVRSMNDPSVGIFGGQVGPSALTVEGLEAALGDSDLGPILEVLRDSWDENNELRAQLKWRRYQSKSARKAMFSQLRAKLRTFFSKPKRS